MLIFREKVGPLQARGRRESKKGAKTQRVVAVCIGGGADASNNYLDF
jgi:hypothetical protein